MWQEIETPKDKQSSQGDLDARASDPPIPGGETIATSGTCFVCEEPHAAIAQWERQDLTAGAVRNQMLKIQCE